MDNQHKKIAGYRDLTQAEIDAMNEIKALEKQVGEVHKKISLLPNLDQRALAIARTDLQQGFMWFVRGVAQPTDPFAREG